MKNYTIFDGHYAYEVSSIFGGIYTITAYKSLYPNFDPYLTALDNKPLLIEDQNLLNKFYNT